MAFGLLNKTTAFLVKTKEGFVNISVFGINVAWGFTEQMVLNITNANASNAMDMAPPVEVPNSQTLIKKCAYITGATLTSSAVKNKVVDVISGATFTGLL